MLAINAGTHLIQSIKNPNRSRDTSKTLLSLLFAVSVLFVGACKTPAETDPPEVDLSSCHIIYDAGSAATRLYIYEQTPEGWNKHYGPRKAALADPVRRNRGKTMSDVDALVGDIVSALDEMRVDGFINKKGKTISPAFDWQAQCDIKSAAVYATAGMILAEKNNAADSADLWKMLNNRLSSRLGMPVTTRTITGYEEGLYAWLAVREQQDDNDFGIAEMGGGSAQVAFPCSSCQATRQVRVNGKNIPIASYSFLGWGQDEAWKSFASEPACERSAGHKNPDWDVSDCTTAIPLSSAVSDEIHAFVSGSDELRWYLTGTFRYMKDTDVDHFCREGIESDFEPETACFRAVYLEHVLKTLGVPAESSKSKLDWTLGAVVCTATQCLDVK